MVANSGQVSDIVYLFIFVMKLDLMNFWIYEYEHGMQLAHPDYSKLSYRVLQQFQNVGRGSYSVVDCKNYVGRYRSLPIIN